MWGAVDCLSTNDQLGYNKENMYSEEEYDTNTLHIFLQENSRHILVYFDQIRKLP
jgi:hypothetical protein